MGGIISLHDESGWQIDGMLNHQAGFGAQCKHDSSLYPAKVISGRTLEDGRLVGHWGFEGTKKEGPFSLSPFYPPASAKVRHREKGDSKEAQEIAEALSKVNAIIQKGEPWTDPDFPPCESSIKKPGDRPLETREWKRASELFPNGFEVFVGGCEPSDINQGALGDCYFLAAIASLAEVHGRV